MKKKILIAGGTGFLGFNVIKKLLKYKFEITSISSNKKSYNKHKKVNYIFCDISNYNKLRKKIKNNYDYLINFSGNIDHSNKNIVKKVHYLGLINLVKCIDIKKLKLFVQIGSSLEYGKSPSPHKESLFCKPVSYYGKSKNLSSKFIRKKIKKFIILRPYQIYGPGQKTDRLIPSVIENCIKNREFNCTEGQQLRDFLHVNDFTKLILKILKKKEIKYGIYNVGTGKPYKVKFIINLIKSLTGKGKPLFGKKKMRKNEIMKLYPDIRKVKKTFNWKPKVEIKKGIQKTIKSYIN